MRPGLSLAAESCQPAPVMPSLLAWLMDPISPPCIGLLLWPAGRGLLQLRLIICSRHCHNSQLLHTEPGPRKRFGESVKFVGSTATHLASTVWPALPQGECRKWGFPYLHVLTVFLFLQALERFLSAWRLKQLLIFPCQVWTPARRISAGAPILVVYWISTGLASTTTGPWRDSCPHPPLPDRISRSLLITLPSLCSLDIVHPHASKLLHHTQEPVLQSSPCPGTSCQSGLLMRRSLTTPLFILATYAIMLP